jgi:hypothetical protein
MALGLNRNPAEKAGNFVEFLIRVGIDTPKFVFESRLLQYADG